MYEDKGGTAFPVYEKPEHGGDIHLLEPGMTMRDYFAAKAMAAVIIATDGYAKGSAVSKAAYFIADAMIQERHRED